MSIKLRCPCSITRHFANTPWHSSCLYFFRQNVALSRYLESPPMRGHVPLWERRRKSHATEAFRYVRAEEARFSVANVFRVLVGLPQQILCVGWTSAIATLLPGRGIGQVHPSPEIQVHPKDGYVGSGKVYWATSGYAGLNPRQGKKERRFRVFVRKVVAEMSMGSRGSCPKGCADSSPVRSSTTDWQKEPHALGHIVSNKQGQQKGLRPRR